MRRKLVEAGVALLLVGGLVFLPCSCQIRESEGWQRSASRIGDIGLAMRGYHDVHAHLPPALVRDKDGHPLYSWRVALLPHLEETEVYESFRLDEPWDSPHN